MIRRIFLPFFITVIMVSCQEPTAQANSDLKRQDSLQKVEEAHLRAKEKAAEEERKRPISPDEIKLKKDITFKKYTLDDNYQYEKKARKFQWDKVKEQLAYIETFQKEANQYGVISNYKNKNGEAALVSAYERNKYNRIADTLGIERYQSVPLYAIGDSEKPVIYGRDGSLVKILSNDGSGMVRVKGLGNFEGEWDIPTRYVKSLGDTPTFDHIVVIDVTNQNIATIEHLGDEWLIRSMNPATTGKSSPPYAMKTPVGMYLLQEKKSKMFYYKDGTTTIHGYAPWASRFTNGAYIHGVPTADPKAPIIEYSWTLGTIPRSHMCVRNASSHAKFIYDWMKTLNSLVIVID